MAKPRLFYIGTSKIKEIRIGASVTFDWGTYGSWTNFKSPVAASQTSVKYSKNTKDKIGSSKYGGLGGVTKLGTTIPATAQRMIGGVERTCEVRYYQRGYTIYERPSSLKKKKKMAKKVYTAAKPKQYRLQYKDKPVTQKAYSTYVNGTEYIYFADHYYIDGVEHPTDGHLPHPTECKVKYSDVRKNFESSANNSDRDNSGSYVLSNVRANVVTLELSWEGLPPEEAADLLDTLNPSRDTTGQYNYLVVQYLDPATNEVKNGTFFASDRSCETMPNGWVKNLSVTLTEV